MLVAAVQDVHEGAPQEIGARVRLGEEPGPDARAELHGALVRHFGDLDVGHGQVFPLRIGSAGGQQPEEVRLA